MKIDLERKLPPPIYKAWHILWCTYEDFSKDKASQVGASLAYFTVFALPPVLILLVQLASLFLDDATVRKQIIMQVHNLSGKAGTDAVEMILTNLKPPDNSTVWAALISVGVLIFSATGIFVQLQDSLNTIWGVRIKPNQDWSKLVMDRVRSFFLLILIGLLMFATVLLDVGLALFQNFLGDYFNIEQLITLLQSSSWLISYGLTTAAFAIVFKVLPDARIAWKDSWIGAFFTASLFTASKVLISWYLSSSSMGYAYGAAGSMMVFLFWIFLAYQLFLLGAEFTEVYAREQGREITPQAHAEWIQARHLVEDAKRAS